MTLRDVFVMVLIIVVGFVTSALIVNGEVCLRRGPHQGCLVVEAW